VMAIFEQRSAAWDCQRRSRKPAGQFVQIDCSDFALTWVN